MFDVHRVPIHSFGYGNGWTLDAVKGLSESGLIADCRLRPWSRTACWRRNVLSDALGDYYIHLPGFGNTAGKGAEKSKLADPVGGYVSLKSRVKDLAMMGQIDPSIYLMCCCPLSIGCHLPEVERVLREFGFVNILGRVLR